MGSYETNGRAPRDAAHGPAASGDGGPPPRPSVRSENLPPVIIKQPPPLAVRLSQLLWVLSFATGGTAIVYFFLVREDQLPLITEAIKQVDSSRIDSVYTSAADIVYWSGFGIMVAILLTQIVLLVSFMSRRSGVRWWQLATLLVEAGLFGLTLEMVGEGEHGANLGQLLLIQGGLALMALIVSTFRSAIEWSARQHDIRRGTIVTPLP